MTLQVIGSGFGRTGTMSLKLALEQLGFGPTYHMVEVFKNPPCVQWWIDAADGHPDWPRIFASYNAAVDWPSATFYAELAAAHPGAKVIHTERDAEAWFKSTQATIFADDISGAAVGPFGEMFEKVIRRLFDGRMHDRDHVIDVYNRHNAAVRATIPAERLLVYEVAQGWDPLCAFLGVAAPDTPMPKANSTEEFVGRRSAARPA